MTTEDRADAADSGAVRFSRSFAMPSADTFSIAPIRRFVRQWLIGCQIVVDPFARNSPLGTHRNDLNPETAAPYHMDAAEFCETLRGQGVVADAVLFDPPYSPRQISECYAAVGRDDGMAATQNAALYSRVRSAIVPLLRPGSAILSFGWNSGGFGKKHSCELREVLLVHHGGAHNDTICTAEIYAPCPDLFSKEVAA